MMSIPRRTLLSGAAATLALSACSSGGRSGAAKVDARADAALAFIDSNHPDTKELREKAAGMLVMPLVTEASFFYGGAYGRGALRINDATVDYYSATQASFGIQAGAQQYAHILYFMTEEALSSFRASKGWAAGADIEYVSKDVGGNIGAETTTALAPIIGIVFGQAGLLAGASVTGTKYTRIIP
ncbi:MAG: twin-arginine translocation pathway signal [Boseongicola sp. SB0677_bin_26]|nr:twin-arginine translocation pathway signal [Boseongicola sp. SB0665_bin_10]MYG26804.1 twin-arginine translocation pathway signal [Boseongicola sp. SB0677_bin_26]